MSGGTTADAGAAPAILELRRAIEEAFEARAGLSSENTPAALRAAIDAVLGLLDAGTVRVAEKVGGTWVVHDWLKKAVLLSFRINDNVPMPAEPSSFYDKVPLKFSGWGRERFAAAGVRVVPPATVRRGAFVAGGVVLIAELREHRRLRRFRHHGGHLGHGRLLRPDRQERPFVRWRRHRRRARTAPGGTHDRRGRVFHRGTFRDRRRGHRRGRRGRLDGRVHRPEHPHLDRESDTISYGRVPAGAVVVPGSLPAATAGTRSAAP